MHLPFFRGWRRRFLNRGQKEREDQDYHQTLALADEFLRKLKWIDWNQLILQAQNNWGDKEQKQVIKL